MGRCWLVRLDVEAPGRCLEDGSVCIIVADCDHSSAIGELEVPRTAETQGVAGVGVVAAPSGASCTLLWPRAHTEAVRLHLTTVTGTAGHGNLQACISPEEAENIAAELQGGC